MKKNPLVTVFMITTVLAAAYAFQQKTEVEKWKKQSMMTESSLLNARAELQRVLESHEKEMIEMQLAAETQQAAKEQSLKKKK